MEKEIWKTIPGFKRYEASNTGKLRSINYKNSGKTKVLKPSLSAGYYKTMLLSNDGKYKTWNVHKFITLAFYGPSKKGLEVNHKDGIKSNNNILNLEYITRSENIKHAVINGLHKPRVGSLNGMSKLTETQVLEIRETAKNGGRYYGRKVLAEKYGVSECTIKEVVTRRKNKFYNA